MPRASRFFDASFDFAVAYNSPLDVADMPAPVREAARALGGLRSGLVPIRALRAGCSMARTVVVPGAR
jgi:hypothetical protein